MGNGNSNGNNVCDDNESINHNNDNNDNNTKNDTFDNNNYTNDYASYNPQEIKVKSQDKLH